MPGHLEFLIAHPAVAHRLLKAHISLLKKNGKTPAAYVKSLKRKEKGQLADALAVVFTRQRFLDR